jgi:hypothetical protein
MMIEEEVGTQLEMLQGILWEARRRQKRGETVECQLQVATEVISDVNHRLQTGRETEVTHLDTTIYREVGRLRAELSTMTENRDRGVVAHNDTMRAWAEQVIDLEQKLDEARKLAWEWRNDAAGYTASPEDALQLYPFPWEEA